MAIEPTPTENLRTELEKGWRDSQQTNPMFILRPSKIRGAGLGVFVNPIYTKAPAGTRIPFYGHILDNATSTLPYVRYQVTNFSHFFSFVN